MKSVLEVVLMVLAIMGLVMLTGCAGQKPVDQTAYNAFFVGSDAAKNKEPINFGEASDSGLMVGSEAGKGKAPISLGEAKDAGLMVGSDAGRDKPGIQLEQAK